LYYLQAFYFFAGKLSDGVSFERILEDLQRSVTNSLTESDAIKRIHLTDRQDLRNICKEFNVTATVTKHQNDLFSVKIWVEEMRALGNDNPVLYVKFQHEEDEVFKKEDFVLVLMTQFQREMYLKFGNDIVCIDGTHGLNAYDFYLYSLVIIDEFGNGVPIAFCFSNLKSTLVYRTFFESIKTQVGGVTPRVFMSDSEIAFYNAWVAIMGAAKFKLLCLWHVFKNWMENSSKITNNHKRELIKKVLRTLCYETDPEKFESCLENFIIELQNDPDTLSFYAYFKKEWYSTCKEWAMCYRKYVGISTNMVLESLHKQIKYHYLLGLTCKRLDKSIHALMRLTNRDVFKRLIKLHRGKPSGKMRSISKSHENSTTVKDEHISSITNKLWSVVSGSKKDIAYEVTKINNTCPEDLCSLKCKPCNICIHMYVCTCLDSIIRLNMCKHIHAVCRVSSSLDNLSEVENLPVSGSFENSLDLENLLLPEIDHHASVNAVSMKERGERLSIIPINNTEDMKCQILSKLHGVVEMCRTIETFPSENEDTRVINRMVDNLMTKLGSYIPNSSNLFVCNNKESTNTRKKISPQKYFVSTQKKKKKLKAVMPCVSYPHATEIIRSLHNKNSMAMNISDSFDHTYE